MKIDINLQQRLNFDFKTKPLLVGGLAMQYYGLRKAGIDVDFILDKVDHNNLKNKLHNVGMIYLPGRNTQGYKKGEGWSGLHSSRIYIELFVDK